MLKIKQDNSRIFFEYWSIFMTSVIMAIILSAICIKFKSIFSIKPDTFLLVFGNFGIAYWIASVINKKHKNDELKVNSFFEELDSLLELISDLRKTINQDKFDDDYSYRSMSLINLQIDLIFKYEFIECKDTEELITKYAELNTMLTGNDKIDVEYKRILIAIEKRILVIKSEILQKM
ncbi:MAG TPA: hypothetical protein EYG85_03695 [Crocinitomix sp.]|nr:hypothetical protein [Crocinitomix sp.]